MVVTTMVMSGAVAGLVGLPQVLSDKHTYSADLTTGLGFGGITVALLGRNNPVGIAIGATVIGFLDAASRVLDFEGIPKEIVQIMQGIIVLSVVVTYEVARRAKERQVQESTSTATTDVAAVPA
jgi:simple sugar transport system permease protein